MSTIEQKEIDLIKQLFRDKETKKSISLENFDKCTFFRVIPTTDAFRNFRDVEEISFGFSDEMVIHTEDRWNPVLKMDDEIKNIANPDYEEAWYEVSIYNTDNALENIIDEVSDLIISPTYLNERLPLLLERLEKLKENLNT